MNYILDARVSDDSCMNTPMEKVLFSSYNRYCIVNRIDRVEFRSYLTEVMTVMRVRYIFLFV